MDSTDGFPVEIGFADSDAVCLEGGKSVFYMFRFFVLRIDREAADVLETNSECGLVRAWCVAVIKFIPFYQGWHRDEVKGAGLV